MVISFSLMNLMFNLGVIRKGEIKSWSLLGIKGLHPLHLNISIQVLHSVLCTFLKVVPRSFVRVKKSRALSIDNHFSCSYDSNEPCSVENLKADHS